MKIQSITRTNYHNSKINRIQINSFVFHLIILIRLQNNSILPAQRQNINKTAGWWGGDTHLKELREIYL